VLCLSTSSGSGCVKLENCASSIGEVSGEGMMFFAHGDQYLGRLSLVRVPL
jgi:hypothetical protein